MTHDPFIMPTQAPSQPAPLGVTAHLRWAQAGAIAAAAAGLCMAATNYIATVTAEDDLAAALAILALLGIAILGGLMGYLTLALWMTRVRSISESQGYPAPAAWKIWAGWFIPFYCLVAPLQVMDGLATKAGKNRMTIFLALWWGGFLLYCAGNYVTGITTLDSGAIALTSGLMCVAVLASMAGLLTLLANISASWAAPAPAMAPPPYGYVQQ